MRQELVVVNPVEHLDPITQPKKEPRPLAHAEVEKIFKVIPSSRLRDRTLFMLLYETGVRVGEALTLQCRDVTLTQDDEKIRVIGRGQRERTVMLTAAPQSIRLLRRHLKQSHIRGSRSVCSPAWIMNKLDKEERRCSLSSQKDRSSGKTDTKEVSL